VIYNVGIAAGVGLADATPEVWDAVLTVNLSGAMLTARTALPVLNVCASMARLRPTPPRELPATWRRRRRLAS